MPPIIAEKSLAVKRPRFIEVFKMLGTLFDEPNSS
jgi:hypothetical protein